MILTADTPHSTSLRYSSRVAAAGVITSHSPWMSRWVGSPCGRALPARPVRRLQEPRAGGPSGGYLIAPRLSYSSSCPRRQAIRSPLWAGRSDVSDRCDGSTLVNRLGRNRIRPPVRIDRIPVHPVEKVEDGGVRTTPAWPGGLQPRRPPGRSARGLPGKRQRSLSSRLRHA
jgi:hypothetical protein